MSNILVKGGHVIVTNCIIAPGGSIVVGEGGKIKIAGVRTSESE